MRRLPCAAAKASLITATPGVSVPSALERTPVDNFHAERLEVARADDAQLRLEVGALARCGFSLQRHDLRPVGLEWMVVGVPRRAPRAAHKRLTEERSKPETRRARPMRRLQPTHLSRARHR